MEAITIHVSGVCLGIMQTTWDQVATLWTAVFTASCRSMIMLISIHTFLLSPLPCS